MLSDPYYIEGEEPGESARRLREEGHSIRAIAKAIGKSKSFVQRSVPVGDSPKFTVRTKKKRGRPRNSAPLRSRFKKPQHPFAQAVQDSYPRTSIKYPVDHAPAHIVTTDARFLRRLAIYRALDSAIVTGDPLEAGSEWRVEVDTPADRPFVFWFQDYLSYYGQPTDERPIGWSRAHELVAMKLVYRKADDLCRNIANGIIFESPDGSILESFGNACVYFLCRHFGFAASEIARRLGRRGDSVANILGEHTGISYKDRCTYIDYDAGTDTVTIETTDPCTREEAEWTRQPREDLADGSTRYTCDAATFRWTLLRAGSEVHHAES